MQHSVSIYPFKLSFFQVESAMSSTSIDTRLTKLVDVQTKFKNANAEPLEALAKDHHMLLKSQVQLQEKLGKDFVGLTLHQTLSDLIQGDEIKQADKLKQDFKLTDRRYVFGSTFYLPNLPNFYEFAP